DGYMERAACPLSGCFFFQAEDGIRDKLVTGVQTCALPICSMRMLAHPSRAFASNQRKAGSCSMWSGSNKAVRTFTSNRERISMRSEERRVGKEGRSRWWQNDEKKKKKNMYSEYGER